MADELGAFHRGGHRLGLPKTWFAVFLAACLSVITTTTSGAAGEPASSTVEVALSCTGSTPEAQSTMRSLGLSTLKVSAVQVAPAAPVLGDKARLDVSLSFMLSDYLAAGAKGVGVDSVDLTGTTAQLRLVGPAGEQSATLSPPKTVVDPRNSGSIQLGSASFELPTSSVGATTAVFGTASVSVRAHLNDLSFTASCTPPALPPLPYVFVVDPAGPKLGTPETSMTSTDRSGTVELAAGVEAPAGSALGGWRVVRTFGGGTAEIAGGRLSWSLADGSPGIDAVWETCAFPTPATTTTETSSTASTSTSTSVAAEAQASTAGDQATSTTVAEAGSADSTTTTVAVAAGQDPHCAQGVVKVRSAAGSEVMSAASTSSGAAAQGGAAPLAFTG